MALFRVDEGLGLPGLDDGREVDSGATGHAIPSKDGGNSSTSVEGFATARRGSNQRALGGGHRDGITDTVNGEGTGDSERNGDVADDIFAAGTKDSAVIVVLEGNRRRFESLGRRSTGWKRS
jgi:hypothetical protein